MASEKYRGVSFGRDFGDFLAIGNGWLFTSDNVRRSRPPRVPVVEVGFDECLVADPDRPRPGILSPPAPGYGNLDECSGVGCPPLQLEPLVRDVPFIAVELDQCAEPL